MYKRLFVLLIALALLPLTPVWARADGVIYAYFQDARWLRAEPAAGSATVDNVPARTMLRLEPVDGKYAATTYKGKPGYIYYRDYVEMDYRDPYAEDAVRGEAEYVMLSTATKNWRAILHFYVDELGMDFWNARLFKRIE